MSAATVPADGDRSPITGPLADRARSMLLANWRDPGFCVPNASVYPWQWLWDSCFHAVCWTHLGEPDRALLELTNLFAHQAPDGFVAHMSYWHGGDHTDFWRRPGTSAITQPPMYGHALATLAAAGVALPPALVARAHLGLRFLLEHRTRPGVGPVVVHPWESGCDDSPRWDGWCVGAWTPPRWKVRKGELVDALVSDAATASPVGSTELEVDSAGFTALVAFNCAELATVTGDGQLAAAAATLARGLDTRWDATRRTWSDVAVVGGASSSTRTLDALLGVLVSDRADAVDAAFAEVLDDGAFGGDCGPAGVHRQEPSFAARTYWRGPAWPQLTYLLWVAATRRGRAGVAEELAQRLVTGARRSRFAEYWDPDSGFGLGAAPQSWTALAAVVEDGRETDEP